MPNAFKSLLLAVLALTSVACAEAPTADESPGSQSASLNPTVAKANMAASPEPRR